MLPLIGVEVRPGDEAVPDRWLRSARPLAEAFRIDGDLAPFDQPQPARRDRLRDDVQRPWIPLKKRRDGQLASEKAVRDLDQEPGAVTALTVRVEPAAVRQPGERLHAQSPRLVGELRGGDKAPAAGGPARGQSPRPGKAR